MSDALAEAPPLSPNPPATGEEAWDEVSPDGLTLVRWGVSHGRMSHVMISPELCDAATGAPFLTLDSSFDGHIRWAADGRFTLHLRHYIRSGDASVEVDRPGARFRFLEQGVTPGPWHPIDRISPEVEARFTPSNDELDRHARAFWGKLNAGKPRPFPQPWGTILFILFVLACLTIVGLFLYAAIARLVG
jgi:hypothetical protein